MIYSSILFAVLLVVIALLAAEVRKYKALNDNRCEALEKYTARMALDIAKLKEHLDTIVQSDMDAMRYEIERMKPETKENNDFQKAYMEGIENIWKYTGHLKSESEE